MRRAGFPAHVAKFVGIPFDGREIPLSDSAFLKNCMEDYVWNFMDEVLSKYPEVCSCAICRHDIAAIALNALPPRYVVREKGEVFSKVSTLEAQYRADVYGALTKAIMIVQSNPRH